ncbi:alpha-1,4-glucan--maltose-1-phosphate maltosyltransferase [Geobacter sp.]|uniref:alpha-1,4-glucan--maltose-1-phosphate maltosyltransferase n=1 Tax=Geobacter sp. TaxID=46610 RepID=UPI0026152EFD|nr:alpha-1,4-glucan--maltose-1-phosphate maltosyltransferase [Geobacter sp.]
MTKFPEDGRRRVAIESVSPEVDGGRFPARRVMGEEVAVEADVFCDGHDELAVSLLYRHADQRAWQRLPMERLGNDRWRASFVVDTLGSWFFTVEGVIDRFATWRHDLVKRLEAGENVAVELQIGAALVNEATGRARGIEAERLARYAEELLAAGNRRGTALAGDAELALLMAAHRDERGTTRYAKELEVVVERTVARFSTWYELFPRSCGTDTVPHGSFADCEKLLPAIARMGFDVVYLPPIHPIGITNRKGKNNSPVAEADDPGSPWAIGSAEGGHTAIHPQLGTLEEFRRFTAAAGDHGLEVALDIAFQCSPDHPWVGEHPEWFRWRPDGTVQYAENPPKKYQDVIPFDFETDAWQPLWEELREVFRFWIGQGITIFRVDNPHTKPFAFWEWVIRELKREHPETVFLSEAFTRPRVMYRLAKLGFSQSYTYFCWRNTKMELELYLAELTRTGVREFFRPNFWPNTPDILPEFLQFGGKPAFAIRYLLAATLSASCGIYGPPFELFVADALPNREEYRDSEKYEVRSWDWETPESLRELITRINRVRREEPALQENGNLHFCATDNGSVIAGLKMAPGRGSILLVVVSLDPFMPQEATVALPLDILGVEEGHPLLVEGLITGERQIWHGAENRLRLDPAGIPGRIFRLRPRLRREHDFDYFM